MYLLSTPNMAASWSATVPQFVTDRIRLTSNLSLLDGWMVLMVLAHPSAISVRERLARGVGGAAGVRRGC